MKKSEKKLFSVVLSVVLIIAMSITTFAANSPSADGVVTVNSGKDANGVEIYYTLEPVAAEYQAVAEAIKDKNNLKAALGSAYTDGMEVVDVRSIVLHEVAVAQAVNGNEIGDDGYVAFPLTLTFNVPGVIKGTKIAMLSYMNGAWQMLQCVAGDGTIDAIFDSAEQFAAVAFVVDKNTTAGNDQTPGKDDQTPGKGDQTSGKNDQVSSNGNQTGIGNTQVSGKNNQTTGTGKNNQTSATGKNTSKVAPKTGESEMIPVLAAMAIVLLIGGSYCLRKRKVR